MQDGIKFQTHCDGIDWVALTDRLKDDKFDNGRTPEELERSFRASGAVCFALHEGEVIGKVRCLTDGVCNAYMIDVWTYTPYRRQGVASQMMEHLCSQLDGQHIYLFTDDMAEFYRSVGFKEQPVGMSKVVGTWLRRG